MSVLVVTPAERLEVKLKVVYVTCAVPGDIAVGRARPAAVGRDLPAPGPAVLAPPAALLPRGSASSLVASLVPVGFVAVAVKIAGNLRFNYYFLFCQERIVYRPGDKCSLGDTVGSGP